MVRQSTLSRTIPKAYRLSDRCRLRKREKCAQHNRSIAAKAFNEEDNLPFAWTDSGHCTVNPRYAVTFPELGTFFFCYKHAPMDLIDTNMVGDWDDEHE